MISDIWETKDVVCCLDTVINCSQHVVSEVHDSIVTNESGVVVPIVQVVQNALMLGINTGWNQTIVFMSCQIWHQMHLVGKCHEAL